jgi:hypothetical protein
VFAAEGVIVTGEVTFTVADALPAPFVAVAFTVHEPASSGAVYSPADVMLPQLAEKLAALLVVNCCVAPCTTVAFDGLIENVGVVGAPTLS